jgi:hypothetical protein
LRTAFYRDADGDGLCDPNNTILACSSTPPPGYVDNSRDTNDTPITVLRSNPTKSDGENAPRAGRKAANKFTLLIQDQLVNQQDFNTLFP